MESCFSELQHILKEQSKPNVLEINIGKKTEIGFLYGKEEDETTEILSNIIKKYGVTPYYYRSTTTFQNNFELSTYGKNRCFVRNSHSIKYINGSTHNDDLQVNIINKSKISPDRFPTSFQYHHSETTETITFNINKNIKINIIHICDEKITTYYNIKLVYLFHPQNNIDEDLLQVSEILNFISHKKM